MRLRDISSILQRTVPRLRVNLSDALLPDKNMGVLVSEVRELDAALRIATDLPVLRPSALTALKNPVFGVLGDSVLASREEGASLTGAVQQVSTPARLLLAALQEVLPEEEPNQLSIRLPQVSSLPDLAAMLDRVQKIFDQALLSTLEVGHFRLSGFDTGTMWINITLDTAEALALMLLVAGVAVATVAKRRSKQAEVEASRPSLSPRDLQSLMDLHAQIIKAEVTQMIAAHTPPELTDEDRSRLRFSATELAALVEHGAEVVPSLKAPAQVRKSLPELAQLIPTPRQHPELPSSAGLASVAGGSNPEGD